MPREPWQASDLPEGDEGDQSADETRALVPAVGARSTNSDL